MTIGDDFYVKLGRMTVAFGELDFMVGFLANNMAVLLGEGEPQLFTARKLDDIKSWARKNERRLGRGLVDDLVAVAGSVKTLLAQRQEAIHGLWLQEGDASTAQVLKLPKGATKGVLSNMDAATVDVLTEQAGSLLKRINEVTAGVLRLAS